MILIDVHKLVESDGIRIGSMHLKNFIQVQLDLPLTLYPMFELIPKPEV